MCRRNKGKLKKISLNAMLKIFGRHKPRAWRLPQKLLLYSGASIKGREWHWGLRRNDKSETFCFLFCFVFSNQRHFETSSDGILKMNMEDKVEEGVKANS